MHPVVALTQLVCRFLPAQPFPVSLPAPSLVAPVVLSHGLLKHLLSLVTGRWLFGDAESELISRMKIPLNVWRRWILDTFHWAYLTRCGPAAQLALAAFFDFVLFDTIQNEIDLGGTTAAARGICVCTTFKTSNFANPAAAES